MKSEQVVASYKSQSSVSPILQYFVAAEGLILILGLGFEK